MRDEVGYFWIETFAPRFNENCIRMLWNFSSAPRNPRWTKYGQSHNLFILWNIILVMGFRRFLGRF